MDSFHLDDGARPRPATLQVADLALMTTFYSETLGLHLAEHDATHATLTAHTGGPPLLHLTASTDVIPKPSRSTGLYHIAFLLPTRVALARLILHVGSRHHPFSGMSDHHVSEAMYLNDPENNGLELYADRPRDTWFTPDDQLIMGTDPLDLEDLLAQAKRDERPWDAIDPGVVIGHMHLQVSDLAHAIAFYHDAIGMDVMMSLSRIGAAFLSVGRYHHHLGINTWAGRGIPPAPPTATGLHTYAWVLPHAEALAALQANLEAREHPFERETDGTLHVIDPDGIVVTFAVGE
jgi:catechol 2,3-dioxygenase